MSASSRGPFLSSTTSDPEAADVVNTTTATTASTSVGSRAARIPLGERSPSRSSLGGMMASYGRRSRMGTVLKTLRLGGKDANIPPLPVKIGRGKSGKHQRRKLGVSLCGAASSKGSPTKSDENEDRYVHVTCGIGIDVHWEKLKRVIVIQMDYLHHGPRVDPSAARGKVRLALEALRGGKGGRTACWAFATFDGHAGTACSQYLRDNFMAHLKRCAREIAYESSAEAAAGARRRAAADDESHDSLGPAGGLSPISDGEGRTSGEEDDDEEEARGEGGEGLVPTEVVLAKLLTDTLSSLTTSFETEATEEGEISGACVISGLYCDGALVLANIGDCQAVYHGHVKSTLGTPITAQTTIHDASNQAEVSRALAAGGFVSSTGRFQGILEPSRTVGDVDVKAEAPKGVIASFPELFKVDIASDVYQGEEPPAIPPFLVLATDGIWDETSANTVIEEVKDGIERIQAHKRRFMVTEKKVHRRMRSMSHRRVTSTGSTTFTDGESDTEDESEFCGSGEWASHGMDLAERVVSLARGRYDDATALVVVFE